MKLAMMGGNGAVRFVHGTCEVWTGPKSPGEFGVSVCTPQGMAGFIFDEVELRQFVEEALKTIDTSAAAALVERQMLERLDLLQEEVGETYLRWRDAVELLAKEFEQQAELPRKGDPARSARAAVWRSCARMLKTLAPIFEGKEDKS